MTAQKPSLFGTSGIRGDSETLFTNQFCFDIGRTFAKFLDSKKINGPVAVGMDPRGSSPRIKAYIEKGLWYGKREIYDQGSTPVPSMCYVLKSNESLAGSLMVTGSHIKANLNGVKFFYNQEEILKDDEKEIQDIYYSIERQVSVPDDFIAELHSDLSASEEYSEMLARLADSPYPSWKVVIDTGDGAQSDVIPQVLKDMGIRVIEFNTTIQGDFFARDTENEPDFYSLEKKVVETGADFGIGYDADGDRCIFFDEHGNFIPGDYTASIVAREAEGDAIVTTVATSQVVDYIDKKVYRTKVGSPHVIAEMKKRNASFSFEPNGGGVSAEIMYTRDGGSTTIKFLNILKKSNKLIGELVSELPKFYLAKAKIDYKWEQKDKIIENVINHYQDKKIDQTDGLKIFLDKSTWLMFRSSANAPEFRIFAESTSQEKSRKLLSEGKALVEKILASS